MWPILAVAAIAIDADAYPSLQAAVDAAARTGGTVTLAARTYPVRSTIVLPSRVALVGQGPATVLRLADGANCAVLRTAGGTTRATGVRVARLVIDGNMGAQTANSYGMALVMASGVVLEDLKVTNCAGTAVKCNRVSRLVARRCDFSRNGRSARWDVSGLDLNGSCFDNLVEGCTASFNNGFRDPALPNPAYDGNGIRIGNRSERNVLRGNVCEGNGRRGIKVQGARNVVAGNTCRDGYGTLIAVFGPEVHGNVVEANVLSCSHPYNVAGIQLGDGYAVRDTTVRGNHITGTTDGIQATRGAAANRYVGNTIVGVRRHGIHLRGSGGNTIEGNRVLNSGKAAIRILAERGATAAGNRVLANVCTDTRPEKQQLWGLVVEADVGPTYVRGNDFRGNKYFPGMKLSGTGQRALENQL